MDGNIPKKIVFTSGKGGVGKSTLATVFAKLLAANGRKVLLMDCDVSLRTLDLFFSVSEDVTCDWYDVISEAANPESALVETTGPVLLAAPVGDVSVTKKDFARLMELYEKDFEYVVLDCPAGVGPVFEAVLFAADFAFVVTTPDAVAARSASVAAEKIYSEKIPSRLIVNRFRKDTVRNERALSLDEAVDHTGVRLIGVVPEDPALSLALLNGELVERSLPSVLAMERILDRLEEKDRPLKI